MSYSSDASQPSDLGAQQSTPLEKLQPVPEWIDCPKCNQHTQTTIQGRSDGKKKFMNVFWWPLPNREHWWEETKWFCQNCNEHLASQKHGKNMEVMV